MSRRDPRWYVWFKATMRWLERHIVVFAVLFLFGVPAAVAVGAEIVSRLPVWLVVGALALGFGYRWGRENEQSTQRRDDEEEYL